jgi:hypothetical protein
MGRQLELIATHADELLLLKTVNEQTGVLIMFVKGPTLLML